MENLLQFDASLYGPGGGPAAYGTSEGRMNGGGWLDGPMAFSDMDGKGVWAPGPEADPQHNGDGPSPMMGGYGQMPIEMMVEGWAGDGRWFG